ncbi:unnamed protein product [Rotaria magnacalcarata]|uniref:CCHC-type domain-containing protein n=2 Tax=Rotaria magnacalcarata TaxID=392030 RepID=A0A816XGX2_9BILA|nr:unnamed protein product [Rotaria magnacalcarata]
MTSDSISSLHRGDQHHLQVKNDDVIESELRNMLTSNSNNALDDHLTHDLNKNNKKKQKQNTRDESQALNAGEASRVNPTTINIVDTNPDHNQIHAVNDNQHRLSLNNFVITNESTRFAQTRYPFPPLVLRFSSGKVTVNQIKESLLDHCKKNHQFDVQVINCRLSSHIFSDNEYDILIYVKDAASFSFLLDEAHWPSVIGNKKYFFPSTPAIPPQLCLLIKNVDLHIDFYEFCTDIRTNYSHIKNIIRMKNKFQNDIKMVKVELTSSSARDELLNKKRIIVNYITYDIIEYLAPPNVLICSKCMALGHFKKQCTQIKETCRTCGDQVEDMKNHKCSNVEKCVHCGRNHKSSSLKCPVVKSFRAELTRKILQIDNQSSPDSRLLNKNVIFNSTNFPPPPAPKSSTLLLNPMMVKLDELINKLPKVKDRLDKFEAKHDKFEQFIFDKNRNDETIIQNMNDMSNNYMILKKDVVQQNLFIERHENLFCKLLIPMLEDVFTFISAKNQNQKGNPLDAHLKCRINRYFIQMKKATEGKPFSS